MNWLRVNLPTWQGRIIAGLGLVAALVAGLWPDHPRPADPVRITAIATAAIIWLFAELGGIGAPSEHDKSLFHKFRDTVTDIEKELLRDQDFHNSFIYKHTEGLREIAAWDNARYEFVDTKLQAKWGPLRAEADRFTALINQYTGPSNGNAQLATAHPVRGDPENPQPWVLQQIKELNDAASALYRNLEEFERFARKRLGQ